jgi:hypothetical protein
MSMMLAVIGYTTLTISRTRTRELVGANNWVEAGHLAFSAVEYALALMERTTLWRTTYPHGTEVPALTKNLGNGSFEVVLVDEDDGNLADQGSDPLRLYGIGRVGDAVRVHSVVIQPEHGLDILRTAIHAETEIQVKGGDELILTGAPASTNGDLRNDEILYGDVETLTVSGGGMTTGVTSITTRKRMPDSGVFEMYRGMATEIPYNGHLVGGVLTPGYNDWGATNEDGLYYIDTLGHDIDLQGIRIHGTLVVRAIGKKVRLKDAVFLKNYRSDYPTLLVDGEVEILMKTNEYTLSEAGWSVNFNPAGAPFDGISDADLVDTYPNEVHGLIHVTGQIRLAETSRIRGAVISNYRIEVDGSNHIIHDRSLYEDPLLGYADPTSPMRVVPGTWRWDAVP